MKKEKGTKRNLLQKLQKRQNTTFDFDVDLTAFYTVKSFILVGHSLIYGYCFINK